jgi:hypothetical protein
VIRLAGRLTPVAVALLLGWSHAGSFLYPSFTGDQGIRLDGAAQLVVGPRRRVWLPFLQLHVHLLYLAGAPLAAYVLVPFAYTVLTLFLLAALCRAALPDEREALVAGAVLLVAFAGSAFHWLGRSLYQEVIVLPIFLALIYLHYFSPGRRWLFLALLAVGMLTREIFWVWWGVFLALGWRERLQPPGFRAAVAALGAIPLVWLLATRQSPALARHPAEQGGLLDGLGGRAAILGRLVLSESFLLAMVCLAIVFGAALAARGRRGLSLPSYHVFSLVSLAAIYGYILLFDPWRTTPGNARAMAPLYAHLLFWAVLAWRDASLLPGRARVAGRLIASIGILTMLKIHGIAGFAGPTALRAALSRAPIEPRSGAAAREAWRAALARALGELRDGRRGPLRVGFVDIPRREYVNVWVAPFLYDRRTAVAADEPLPAADVLLAPAGYEAGGWALRERLRLPDGLVRDVLGPARRAS